jgi:putative phosphoesterase
MPLTCDRFLPPDLPADRVAARIGLVSDTHMPDRCAALPPSLFDVLQGVDLLLHAGDVGELWALDQLAALAPLVAVHGNDDTEDAQRELPYQQLIVVANQRIVLTHAHYPDRAQELESRRDDAWGSKLERRAAFGRRAGASIVVFGHTHVPMARRYDGILLVNPGAIASPNYVTRQTLRSVALLFIRDDGAPFVAHIDLAAPEQAFEPQVDWAAGFRAAHDRCSESILASDLAGDVRYLDEQIRPLLPASALGELRDLQRRVAYPCWSGERAAITRADLLAELRAADLPAEVRTRFESVLAR